ncbi:asparaginase [Roseivirga sp.]|uniref:asparaginase n=1 Tax=Roseivirga sp. TaxID=1964215 RepID=UPI003B51E108
MIEVKTIEHFDFAEKAKARVLIIYTGGTLGMDFNENGALAPCSFDRILNRVPVIKELQVNLSVVSFNEPIDSSNVHIEHWQLLASLIYEHYDQYNGFLILHGTDTMAYSASALSFMLEGVNKPVIFTGAQLPIASPRSDATENLVTSLEIAADHKDGRPIITEVCIFFNHVLLRGNRAKKVESQHFDAFESENYPILAEAGISIDYHWSYLKPYAEDFVQVHAAMDNNIAVLKLFPGLNQTTASAVLLSDSVKGIILESYGSGNVPHEKWFLDLLRESIDKGKLILNVSQCNGGRVLHGKYETSSELDRIGVVSGHDLTFEAATAKMMFVLANLDNMRDAKKCLRTSIRGEMN